MSNNLRKADPNNECVFVCVVQSADESDGIEFHETQAQAEEYARGILDQYEPGDGHCHVYVCKVIKQGSANS